jgi:hypothetical protein
MKMETNGEATSALGDYFDKVKRALDGKPGTTATKLSSIEVKTFFELTQQWTVMTVRERDETAELVRSKDTVFLTYLGREGSLRLVVPHEVTEVIARQRDGLVKKTRKRIGRELAAKRMAAGWKPTFGGKRGRRKKKQKENERVG